MVKPDTLTLKSQMNLTLKKISKVKKRTSLTLKKTKEGIPEMNLNLAWEALFDHFLNVDTKSNLSCLNTLAGITQKLTASYNQMKSLDIKTRELALKEEGLRDKTELSPVTSQRKGLTEETLSLIEKQLNLI